MCMLTFLPGGIQPDSDALTNGAKTNNQGHGYAIVIPDVENPKLLVRRGMDSEQLIKQFVHERALYPDGPALFHSRWSTGGDVNKFNCHPFYMDTNKQTVVAHNGILPTHMQPYKDDPRCDTHMAAEQIFTKYFGHLKREKSRERLAKAIGGGNKLVILTIDPDYPDWGYIINEKSGQWHEGIWYSNNGFRSWSNSTIYTSGKYCGSSALIKDITDRLSITPISIGSSVINNAGGRYEMLPDMDAWDCLACGGINSIDPDKGYCSYCNTCGGCMEDKVSCTCDDGDFIPNRGWWSTDPDMPDISMNTP